MISKKKQLQCKLVEGCPSHFTEGYSGPLCSTRFFLLCPFHRLLGFFRAPGLSHMVPPTPPPPPPKPIPVVQQLCHTFYCTTCVWKNAHFLACPLCSVSVADYGLVADLFKVRHIFANWLLYSIVQVQVIAWPVVVFGNNTASDI